MSPPRSVQQYYFRADLIWWDGPFNMFDTFPGSLLTLLKRGKKLTAAVQKCSLQVRETFDKNEEGNCTAFAN